MASRRRENPYLYPKGTELRSSSKDKDTFKFINKKREEDEEMKLYKHMLENSGL